ncbi:hypothetical protein [Ureaplasma ceti]|uniref:Uncharacterized protein n=1 Tax=Ureaplasma ceti TaxID=3119530 RepID=A0ABP9UB81_9BACT
MKAFQNKNHTLFGFVNLIVAFLSCLIVYVPMGLYISKYHEISASSNLNTVKDWLNLAQPGYFKGGSLASALIITFILSFLTIGACYLWFKSLQNRSSEVDIPQQAFSAAKWVGILTVIMIICLLISFFIGWLMPVQTERDSIDMAKTIAFRRIVLYAVLGTLFSVSNILVSVVGISYIQLRISHANLISGESHSHENH